MTVTNTILPCVNLLQNQGAKLEETPFHHHAYEQWPCVLKGYAVFENGQGEKVDVGPEDTVYIHSNEPRRVDVPGEEDVEALCVIDWPGNGEDCNPSVPRGVTSGACFHYLSHV